MVLDPDTNSTRFPADIVTLTIVDDGWSLTDDGRDHGYSPGKAGRVARFAQGLSELAQLEFLPDQQEKW
eukprot:4855532-Alexandrium_andersonii.AAC.1